MHTARESIEEQHDQLIDKLDQLFDAASKLDSARFALEDEIHKIDPDEKYIGRFMLLFGLTYEFKHSEIAANTYENLYTANDAVQELYYQTMMAVYRTYVLQKAERNGLTVSEKDVYEYARKSLNYGHKDVRLLIPTKTTYKYTTNEHNTK